MKKLLEKYCLDESETGLLLLDMPTGTGKTHNVLEFIKDYLRSDKNKKIFFVTTLKKNVDDPYQKLLAALETDKQLKDLVFRIKSNKEYAIEHFEEVREKINIPEIKRTEEYKNFNALIAAGVKSPDTFGETERKLRQVIAKVLSQKFKKKEEKVFAIKNDNNWKWVSELYPVVFSEEKRIFFITMKKLINQFDTIVEKSVRLYENKLFRNSLVFIDEFDATKSDIQDAIVQEGLTKSVDYLDLFRNIKISLDKSDTIPANILDNVGNKPSHKNALERNIKLFDEIAEKYNLLLNHKSEGFEEKRFVLFSDLSCNCYTTGEEDVIAKYDEEGNIKRLHLVNKELKDRSLYEALDMIKGAVSFFARFVTILSYSYYQNKRNHKEEGKSYGEFTEFHALDTVLDSLHIQGDAARVIRQMALTNSYRYKAKKKNEDDVKDDLSFYAHGFSHYGFTDSNNHDNKTIISKYVFEDTPESILCDICNQSKVVGISATATFNTVLGNYDIEYLKWRLGDTYVNLTEAEKKRLRETFENQSKGYDNVEINVELTDTCSQETPDWNRIFKDNEVACCAQQLVGSDKNIYNEVRYFKALLAFKQFEDNEIQSYLALFTKGAKKKDSEFDREKLDKLFELYEKDCGKRYEKRIFVTIDSDNFYETKNTLLTELKAGERRFIMSTYATLGAGQNLQYGIPDSRRDGIVKINERLGDAEEMDIEGMYLDRPTNLIYRYSDVPETAINRVFQMEYLFNVNAISYNQKMTEIANTYKCVNVVDGRRPQQVIKSTELRDVRVYATKIIVQAVGRKCRTNNRSKQIFMLADSELRGILDVNTLFHENRMFNKELIEVAKRLNCEVEEQENRYNEIAKKDAIQSNKRIKDLLSRCFEHSWNDTDIKIWQRAREYALMHPTLTEDEWRKSPYRYHYITFGTPVNQYYYQQNGDFDVVRDVCLTKPNESSGTVSDGDANLNAILEKFQNGKLRDYFDKNGYATKFEIGDYIMTPPFYQNIYKGALGEVIGKQIFKHFQIELEELDKEEYEMFDYKVVGKPIYVDFKYWKESSRFNAEEYHNKILEKAKKCEEIKCVIIANVRDTGVDEVNVTKKNGIHIVELSLICNSDLSRKAALKIQEFK